MSQDRVEIIPNIDFVYGPRVGHIAPTRQNDNKKNTPVVMNNLAAGAEGANSSRKINTVPKMKHKPTQEEQTEQVESGSFFTSMWLVLTCICIIIVLIVAIIWLIYKLNESTAVIKRLSICSPMGLPMNNMMVAAPQTTKHPGYLVNNHQYQMQDRHPMEAVNNYYPSTHMLDQESQETQKTKKHVRINEALNTEKIISAPQKEQTSPTLSELEAVKNRLIVNTTETTTGTNKEIAVATECLPESETQQISSPTDSSANFAEVKYNSVDDIKSQLHEYMSNNE